MADAQKTVRDEKDLRALLREELGLKLADQIAEKREESAEAVAKAKEKDPAEFRKLLAEVIGDKQTRGITRSGELFELEPGVHRSPGASPAGQLLGLSVRAAAAMREQKIADEDLQAAAADWLQKNYKDHPLGELAAKSISDNGSKIKSLNASSQTAGGLFVQDQTADAVIELLRPQVALMALGPREVPLPGGTLILPTHTSGSSGTWLGEEEEIQTTQPAFGERTLRGKTYAAMVLISNKLLKSASIQMDAFVSTDLRMDAGTALDLAFIRGNSAARPKGVRYLGTATATSNSSATLDSIDVDIVSCMARMGAAGLTMTRLGSMFSWREWQKLFNLRFTSGDKYVYRDELTTGNLLGFPYRRTSNIPTNLGGSTNESEFYLMDMDHVVVGRGEAFAIDISTEASVNVGGTQINTYQKNQSAIRMMVETDINIRHAAAVQVVTGVTWGA